MWIREPVDLIDRDIGKQSLVDLIHIQLQLIHQRVWSVQHRLNDMGDYIGKGLTGHWEVVACESIYSQERNLDALHPDSGETWCCHSHGQVH
jgi:hypothetical protein